MKKFVVTLIFLGLTISAAGQASPLTQTEYVKMLYALQKDPGSKTGIIEALRKRGIDFDVTDGIRSLTRSKGANDEELKRALDGSQPAKEAQAKPVSYRKGRRAVRR